MNKALCAVLLSAAVAACGSVGPAGPAGPSGPMGTMGAPGTNGTDFQTVPSISLVTPNKVVVGRSAEVAISGFGTKWTAAARVAFGAGITVSNVRVASPTALLADIAVSADAAIGTRDVTVTEGAAVASYTGAFTVLPLFTVTLPVKATRGAMFAIVIHHNDPKFLFTGAPALTLTPPPSAGGDLRTFVNITSPQDLVVQVFADFTAPLGKRSLTLVANRGTLRELTIERAEAFELTEKVELPLTDDSPAMGTLSEAYSGALFKYVPGAAELRKFTFDTTASGKPYLFLLSSTGVYEDRLTEGPDNVLATCPVEGCYVSAFDTSGTAGLPYVMKAVAPPGGPEVEPNDTLSTAQPLTLLPEGNVGQVFVTSAQLSTLGDEDWFKLTLSTADVGKRLRVVTAGGDRLTDTQVDVQSSSGASLGGPSDDRVLHEDFTSAPIPAAGDYFVKVYYSNFVFSFDPAESRYVLSLTLQ